MRVTTTTRVTNGCDSKSRSCSHAARASHAGTDLGHASNEASLNRNNLKFGIAYGVSSGNWQTTVGLDYRGANHELRADDGAGNHFTASGTFTDASGNTSDSRLKLSTVGVSLGYLFN